MKLKRWLCCAVLVAVAGVWFMLAAWFSVQEPAHAEPSILDNPPYQGKVTVVARLSGQTTYHVVMFEGSDALYLLGGKYYTVAPFLDGDGTPVTYKEYVERMEQK